jgi:hypothetical protein
VESKRQDGGCLCLSAMYELSVCDVLFTQDKTSKRVILGWAEVKLEVLEFISFV